MTQEDVVRAFVQKKVNKRQGSVYWESSGVLADGDNLYYYGTLIAKRLGDIYLKNGDRYAKRGSFGGSDIEWYVQNHIKKGAITSFRALEGAGINPEKLERKNILHWSDVDEMHVFMDTKGFLWDNTMQQIEKPKQGMFIPDGRYPYAKLVDGKFMYVYIVVPNEKYEYRYGRWHILGGVVVEWNGEHYYGGLDDQNYFIAQLPGKANTVQSAINLLKPKEVKKAEKDGAIIKRQGEWFFIPTGKTNKDLAGEFDMTQKILKENCFKTSLPKQNPESNEHHAILFQRDGTTYACGSVYHRTPKKYFNKDDFYGGNSTGEHLSLNLGDEWHIAAKNTEKASWSFTGSFD